MLLLYIKSRYNAIKNGHARRVLNCIAFNVLQVTRESSLDMSKVVHPEGSEFAQGSASLTTSPPGHNPTVLSMPLQMWHPRHIQSTDLLNYS